MQQWKAQQQRGLIAFATSKELASPRQINGWPGLDLYRSFFNLPQLMAMAVGWKAGLRFGVDPMPAPLCRLHGEALREMKDGLALYTMNRKTIQLARDERWVGLVHDE